MTGFNHGLTGAVIALSVKRPELAIPLSFVSHYLTDILPHFGVKQGQVLEKNFNLFIEFDFVFSVIMMICLAALFPSQTLIIWICMIAAAIPDIHWWFYRDTVKFWPKKIDKFLAFHYRLNNHIKNFYYDAAYFLAAWSIIFYIKFS